MSGTYTQRRSRAVTVRGLAWVASDATPGASFTNEASEFVIPGSQVTTSFRSGVVGDRLEVENPDTHIYERPGAPRPLGGSLRDTGHSFYSRTEEFNYTSHPRFTWHTTRGLTSGYTRHFQGPVVIDLQPFSSDLLPPVPPLNVWGGPDTALAQRLLKIATPTRANAGLNQMIGEITNDGLPSLANPISRRQGNPAFFGKAYVNTEFAWKPLVSDVTKLIRSLKKANTILRQFERDSGKVVRRRVGLPETVENSEYWDNRYSLNVGVAPLQNYGFYHKEGVKVEQRKTTQTWFSGAFTYYVKTDSSVIAKLERYEQLGNKLLGTRLTVDILWELAPWSWLIDWVSSVGDSLTNAVSFQDDGLVMPWGYMMRKTTIRSLATSTLFNYSTGEAEYPFRNAFSVVQKERVKATPYGFGLSLEAFSLKQWAILAALGLSRAPSRL